MYVLFTNTQCETIHHRGISRIIPTPPYIYFFFFFSWEKMEESSSSIASGVCQSHRKYTVLPVVKPIYASTMEFCYTRKIFVLFFFFFFFYFLQRQQQRKILARCRRDIQRMTLQKRVLFFVCVCLYVYIITAMI